MPVTELSRKVAALEAKLNKKPNVKGARVCTDIELAPNTYFLRRPSGIMPLDIHTGGGLPAGGLTYLSGPDGAGKTFLLYKYLAMNQRLYGDKSAVALGVSEAAPDHFFMRKCGVQIAVPEPMIAEQVAERKERNEPPFTKEQLKEFRAKTVGTVKLLRGSHGEELLGAILECFDTGLFDIVGLDSISAVLPEADAMKDLDDAAKRAAAASMVTRFFQHYLNGTTGYYGLNPTTVIFTSQVRSNSKKSEGGPGAKWLLDYAPQGAWAAKHGKLIDILLKPGAKDKEEVQTAPGVPSSLAEAAEAEKKYKKKVQVGKTMNYEVLKGKAGVHEGITGEFEFHFPLGAAMMRDPNHLLTEDQRMIVVAGLQAGIVEEKDGLVSFHHPTTLAPIVHGDLMLKKIAGIDRLAQMMRADFELELALRRAVLSSVGIECAYR
jgi:RecA/RadA recombinase